MARVCNKKGEAFGQKDDLVSHINDVIRNSSSICVFKELIQNADDAGASQIVFILDSRELKKSKTFGPMFNKLQGPSLLCWNDSIMSEDDLMSITNLAVGSKQKRLEKTARFGVGFNSVYHFTDVPQLISNYEDYVILDPLCAHFPNLNKSSTGRRIRKIKNNLKNDVFQDVLSGFLVTDDSQFKLEGSTMFRFALRAKSSDISKSEFNIKKLHDIIDEFTSVEKECLLFLKNIKSIMFYSLNQDGKLELINKQERRFINKHEQKKRSEFILNLKNQIAFNKFADSKFQQIEYMIQIDTNSSRVKYLVLEQFGFLSNSLSHDMKSGLELIRKSYIPFGGIAINMNFFRNSNNAENLIHKFYSTLPIDQKSPLRVHLNGSWALDKENRMQIVDYNSRTVSAENEWNKCLINLLIFPLYLRLFEYLKTSINMFANYDLFIESYLNIFPQGDVDRYLEPYFRDFFSNFYKKIYEMELVPNINQNNELSWCPLSEHYFNTSLNSFLDNYYKNEPEREQRINQFNELLLNASIKLYRHKESIDLYRHNELINSFHKFSNIRLNKLIVSEILLAFKEKHMSLNQQPIDETIIKNRENLKCLLEFLFREIDDLNLTPELEGCPLLLRKDQILVSFSSRNKMFYYENPGIFKTKEGLFLDDSMLRLFNGNQVFFRSININDLAILLPVLLDSNKYQTIYKNEYIRLDLDKKDILVKIWSIILADLKSRSASYATTFEPIKYWKLIPIICSNSTKAVFLSSIENSDSIIYSTDENNRLLKIFKSINVPIFDCKAPGIASEIFYPILSKLAINENLLKILVSLESKYVELFSDKENCKYFVEYLADCCYGYYKANNFRLQNANSMDTKTIKTILRRLPIYEDLLFERFTSLTKHSIYRFNTENVPKLFLEKIIVSQDSNEKADFMDFCNQEQIIIIENKERSRKLFDYLDIEIKTCNQLYELFFDWVTRKPKTHYKILKDHVHIVTSENIDQNGPFWRILRNLPFINICGDYFKVNECYDNQDKHFKDEFPNRLLPEDYNEPFFKKDVLVKMGLKTNVFSNPNPIQYKQDKKSDLKSNQFLVSDQEQLKRQDEEWILKTNSFLVSDQMKFKSQNKMSSCIVL